MSTSPPPPLPGPSWSRRFDVFQFISAECHEKASSLVTESVTQGCSAWLRFEPDVVALSILLLAVGTTSSRDELIERVSFSGKSQKS